MKNENNYLWLSQNVSVITVTFLFIYLFFHLFLLVGG